MSTRRWSLVVFVVATCVGFGCTTATPESSSTTTTTAPAPSAAGAGTTEVPELGLTLDLPQSFQVADDPDMAFLARSFSPRAILSIAPESSSIVDHQPERGETVSEGSVGGHDAVTVLEAKVAGLPPGIVANELLVDNGDDSFSLIFSSDPASLATLWQPLVDSIRFNG